jgi:hypothetical protein
MRILLPPPIITAVQVDQSLGTVSFNWVALQPTANVTCVGPKRADTFLSKGYPKN